MDYSVPRTRLASEKRQKSLTANTSSELVARTEVRRKDTDPQHKEHQNILFYFIIFIFIFFAVSELLHGKQ